MALSEKQILAVIYSIYCKILNIVAIIIVYAKKTKQNFLLQLTYHDETSQLLNLIIINKHSYKMVNLYD